MFLLETGNDTYFKHSFIKKENNNLSKEVETFFKHWLQIFEKTNFIIIYDNKDCIYDYYQDIDEFYNNFYINRLGIKDEKEITIILWSRTPIDNFEESVDKFKKSLKDILYI